MTTRAQALAARLPVHQQRVVIVGRPPLDRAPEPEVPTRASLGGRPREHRLAQAPMVDPDPRIGVAGRPAQQRVITQLREQRARRAGQLGGLEREVGVELADRDRDRLDDRALLERELLDPPLEHAPELEARVAAEPSQRGGTCPREQAGALQRDEGIALRVPGDRVDLLRVRASRPLDRGVARERVERRRGEPRERVGRERTQAQRPVRVGAQQQLEQPAALPRLRRRARQQQQRRRRLAQHRLEQRRRVAIGPLRVVDPEDQREASRGPAQQRAQGREAALPQLDRVDSRPLGARLIHVRARVYAGERLDLRERGEQLEQRRPILGARRPERALVVARVVLQRAGEPRERPREPVDDRVPGVVRDPLARAAAAPQDQDLARALVLVMSREEGPHER